MKKLQIAFVFIVIAIAGTINLNAEIVTCKDGSQYDVLSIVKSNAMGIVVNTTVNAHGQDKAWIPYNIMKPEDQKRFGFDQQKFDDYVRKMAEGDKTLADDPDATPNYRIPQVTGTVTQYVIPQTTTPAQYCQQQMQKNQVRVNSDQGTRGTTPIIAGKVSDPAIATTTSAYAAVVSTQQAVASVPGAGVAVSPKRFDVNTPIGNVVISPYGIAVNTPVTNVGVSTNYIGVQTPIASIALTPGPLPCYECAPVVPIVPAQIPLVGVPIGGYGYDYAPIITNVPAVNAVGIQAGPVVVYSDGYQPTFVNYTGTFLPWCQSYGFGTYGYSANNGWRYGYGIIPSYYGWGGPNVFGGARGGCYSGGGWTQYSR